MGEELFGLVNVPVCTVNLQEEFVVVSVSQTDLSIDQVHREAHKCNPAKYILVNVALNCERKTGKKKAGAEPNPRKRAAFLVRLLRNIVKTLVTKTE